MVHNAAAQLTAAETAKISSGTKIYIEQLLQSTDSFLVVLFGDPKNGTAVGSVPASKTLVVCHKGDNICEHGIIVSDPHLSVSLL